MKRFAFSLFLALLLVRHVAACACGCGVFEVGTRSMIPAHPGSMLSLEFDEQNQNRNWHGDSAASAEANDDKKIQSRFITLSYQNMLNRKWGFSVDLPYTQRNFKTSADDDTVTTVDHSAVGDIRLKAIFTGFTDRMTTGVILGVKLASGDYTFADLDPDTAIGSGSTDLLLGAFHTMEIPRSNWNVYASGELDQPVFHRTAYRPATEANAVIGTYYDHWKMGRVKLAPLVQLIGSLRWRDTGRQALSEDTGYERLLAAPGLELDIAPFSIYGDIGFPIYQRVNGNQLVASQYVKGVASYHF